MNAALNSFQRRVLRHVADFAAPFECVKRIVIFGSVARGEIASAADVDLAVDYLPLDEIAASCSESYTAFQAAWDDWATASSQQFGKPFRFARVYIDEIDKEVWQAITLAALNPVAVEGKAVLAATPRHARKVRE